MAILFGPFGCTLRWLLSMTNYKLPGSWKWLPIGTLAANMLGCTIDYFVGVSRFHCLHAEGYTSQNTCTCLSQLI